MAWGECLETTAIRHSVYVGDPSRGSNLAKPAFAGKAGGERSGNYGFAPPRCGFRRLLRNHTWSWQARESMHKKSLIGVRAGALVKTGKACYNDDIEFGRV
jgi:hypothetical protein